MSDILFAKSLAGHDKDEYFVIVGEEQDSYFVSNGKNRTLELPKKKKKKHVQIIKHLPKDVTDLLAGEKWTDEKIKRALKIYKRSFECQKQM